jgi:hypothetical protein
MMTLLAALAMRSAQSFPPPRIELGTSAMEPFSSCGSSCSMMPRQDYYAYKRKADFATCALPSAKAWDHNGGTIVWARNKRAQNHGAWDDKEVGECTCTRTRTDAAGNTRYSQRKFIVMHNDQPVTTITESHRKCNEIQCQPRVISLLLLSALHFVQTRAKSVGGGGRAIAKLVLVRGMLWEVVAAETCTGTSAGLAPDQCAAWGQFWDGASGPNWTGWGQGCTKLDPCACCPRAAFFCSVHCTGSSIDYM